MTIHVAASRVGESDFERELAARLGLQGVYVAPARVKDASVASRAAALMAARMLPRLMPLEGVIGFSGGYTVAQLAHALEAMPGRDLTIVPLQGNWVEGGQHVHNDQVCRDAANRMQVRALSLPAPMVVDLADTRDALLRDRSIRPVTSRWSELNIAIVGIGPAPGGGGLDYLSVMGQLPGEVRSELEDQGVVGDLCGHMFDGEGHFVEHEVSRRTLSISVDELRRVPHVVAVAGGTSKAASLLGAVRTGIPSTLITDQLTAESLSSLTEGANQVPA